MKGQGPFEVYHAFITNAAITKLRLLQEAEDRVLYKLQHLRMQSVDKAPDWEHCVHIQFEPGGYQRNVFLGMLASKLVHDGKDPVEIAKSDCCLWVKVE